MQTLMKSMGHLSDFTEKCKGYCAGHFAWAYDDFRGNNSFDFKV